MAGIEYIATYHSRKKSDGLWTIIKGTRNSFKGNNSHLEIFTFFLTGGGVTLKRQEFAPTWEHLGAAPIFEFKY